MKIALLNDTSSHENWGCAATSAGLKSVLKRQMPEAEVVVFAAESLPFAKLRFRRQRLNQKISHAVMQSRDSDGLLKFLRQYAFDPASIVDADFVVLNGEGMIHSKSGHLVRLLGILELARRLGRKTAIVNQSVDLEPDSELAGLLTMVYQNLDIVFVRDSDSFRLLQNLGIRKTKLVPDAAFATPIPNSQEVSGVIAKHSLPDRYVTMTGSSALNKSNIKEFSAVYRAAINAFGLPVVILASTKTDLKLATNLNPAGLEPIVIDGRTNYKDVVSIIAASSALIGGRFHPLIFAALVGTPILGFSGNTHKVNGLLNYLEYPIEQQSWTDIISTERALEKVLVQHQILSKSLESRATILTSLLGESKFLDNDE